MSFPHLVVPPVNTSQHMGSHSRKEETTHCTALQAVNGTVKTAWV